MMYEADNQGISAIQYSQDFSNEMLSELMNEGGNGVHLNMDNMNVMNSYESKASTPNMAMM